MAEARKKPLRLFDLVFYTVVATIGIRWLPVAAAAGAASLPLWLMAFLCFYVPLAVAVVQMTSHFPGSGSLYGWTRDAIGPLNGFVCGWFYWTSMLPYFAGLIYFLTELVLSAAGWNTHDPVLYLAVAIALTVMVTVLQLGGLGLVKWLPNVGGIGSWAIFLLLVVAAVMIGMQGRGATDFLHTSYLPQMHFDTAILWGTMVFAFLGPETLAFLRDDIDGGVRTIFKALLLLGVSIVVIYGIGTAAMLTILPGAQLTRLAGLPDALHAAMSQVGHPELALIAIGALALANLGGLSAWFVIAIRLPVEAGIDRFLPASFIAQNPRTGAPVKAVLLQGALTLALVILGKTGTGIAEAYDFLVLMAILTSTIPIVYLFLVYLMPGRWPSSVEAWSPPGGAVTARILGVIGFCSTVFAIAVSMVPEAGDPHPLWSVAKIVLSTAAMLAAGLALYGFERRRRLSRAALPPAQHTATEET